MDDDELFAHFYGDPRPERLVGFIERYETRVRGAEAFPPVAGFFAVVFRQHADWIERLVPGHFDARTAETVAAALRLSGQLAVGESLKSRLVEAGSDATLSAALANLPLRLEDLRVVTPTHLDILWGASFASGDARYVRMIVGFLAKTANLSELIALDIARIAVVIAGVPSDSFGQLNGKYGALRARKIGFAATAAWSLRANARQHPFVEKVVTDYIAEHSGSHAAKVLSTLHQPKR